MDLGAESRDEAASNRLRRHKVGLTTLVQRPFPTIRSLESVAGVDCR